LDLKLKLHGGEETLGLALFCLFLLSQLLLGLGLLEGVRGAHHLARGLLLKKLFFLVDFVDLLCASMDYGVRVVLRRVSEGRLVALGGLLLGLRIVVIVLEDAGEPAVDVVGFVRGVLALADDLELQEQLALEAVVGPLEELLVHVGEFELELLQVVYAQDEHVAVLDRLHCEPPHHVAALEGAGVEANLQGQHVLLHSDVDVPEVLSCLHHEVDLVVVTREHISGRAFDEEVYYES